MGSDLGSSFPIPEPGLTIDDVQRHLNRSRASVYRYANTDPDLLNPPYDPKKLNPELRQNKDEPLLFRPQEVRRFGVAIASVSFYACHNWSGDPQPRLRKRP